MSHLNVPSFSDFLDDMGLDRAAQWQKNAMRAAHEIGLSFDLSNPEDCQHFVAALYVLNQQTFFQMMADYHEWLIQKLDAASLHLI